VIDYVEEAEEEAKGILWDVKARSNILSSIEEAIEKREAQ
jgi:hypothetical protein